MERPPRYFPVSPTPLKMSAGLARHGTDFGEPSWDRLFFQRDAHYARYHAAKCAAPAERHQICGRDASAEGARGAALSFMRATLAVEAPEALAAADADGTARDAFEAIARVIQEDFAVIAADAQTDRLVAVDIRFPSGFRPEQLAGQCFHSVHVPVPQFADSGAAARSMVRSMTERGPYVRFVWALCTDDLLDHHPDAWPGNTWDDATRAFLRVERQSTVPFPDASAALFLIRTHLYSVESLTDEQRSTLRKALETMPEELRQYKRLPSAARFATLLERA
jgi:hypothetical protein